MVAGFLYATERDSGVMSSKSDTAPENLDLQDNNACPTESEATQFAIQLTRKSHSCCRTASARPRAAAHRNAAP